ncbi:HNH endonuclease [Nostoc parmelioides]|uniref:HNH endonuclease n=1 Tax=Nostoc parmelioides FACHB-3921 TaxID=2692909 RepID=A0ABR8BNR8_9NOSO|nr:HNH endonuclease [Nostoc parmelioides]MBD2255778.1 HNH endonuclease [Nostoc parmelioides FACHB-3921]
MGQGVYPENWKEIATALKAASNWRCAKCGRVCLRPGEKPDNLTFSERKAHTLQVHHWNRDPSDNRLENLVCLCSGCHLSYHCFSRGNVSPGQLSLFAEQKVS